MLVLTLRLINTETRSPSWHLKILAHTAQPAHCIKPKYRVKSVDSTWDMLLNTTENNSDSSFSLYKQINQTCWERALCLSVIFLHCKPVYQLSKCFYKVKDKSKKEHNHGIWKLEKNKCAGICTWNHWEVMNYPSHKSSWMVIKSLEYTV